MKLYLRTENIMPLRLDKPIYTHFGLKTLNAIKSLSLMI